MMKGTEPQKAPQSSSGMPIRGPMKAVVSAPITARPAPVSVQMLLLASCLTRTTSCVNSSMRLSFRAETRLASAWSASSLSQAKVTAVASLRPNSICFL